MRMTMYVLIALLIGTLIGLWWNTDLWHAWITFLACCVALCIGILLTLSFCEDARPTKRRAF